MIPFVGRKEELDNLKRLLKKKTASLVVIKGRRRIGKSRLVKEFAKQTDYKFYNFSGLYPSPGISSQDQKDHFGKQLGKHFGVEGLGFVIKANDWFDLFNLLAKNVAKENAIILFDEISWMGFDDHTFLPKLKNLWDDYFAQHSNLILILCGSVSTWIEKNIISSKGFLGRINLKITLKELSLPECNILLQSIKFHGSAMEKFMILSVTGGVPWYIEQIEPTLSAAENIKRLCFKEEGLLVKEFEYIFNDLFRGRRGEICKDIVKFLAKGSAEYTDIADHVKYASSGPLSEYLEELVISDFVSRDFIWDFKTGKVVRTSKFRLKDNYLRFYLKYIGSNLEKINKGKFENVSITSLPGWESILGLQFENLVVNNGRLLINKLEIREEEVVFDNPYFQRATRAQRGCQIDFLIQTKYNNLFVCEIKFMQHEIGLQVIKEIKEKIKNLRKPKSFYCAPVLIHVNGVKPEVEEADFCAKIIDFRELLF